jgi:hypothetical protein
MTPKEGTPEAGSRWDWLAALFLFGTTALVVVWQNARLGVLWDLSYVLENSFRISLGQIPYRDFPFPYPPLTFLIQAALIKIGGRVFWHHVVYCALMSGGATVLTWRIVINVLREMPHARLTAFILSLPLILLGIYSVFPHPFYDPDCTFAMLLSILLVQIFADPEASIWGGVLAGTMLVIPLFIKQNTGSAFLIVMSLAILALAAINLKRHQPAGRYAAMLIGAGIGLFMALLAIQFTAGLESYLHWTIQYAASRRMPTTANMLGVYADPSLAIWIACFGLGALLLFWGRAEASAFLSALLFAAPFAWPAFYVFLNPDPSERADRLLALWPALLIVSFVVGVLGVRPKVDFSTLLPFVLIAVINAAFMSQQLWGSTYAIWPLFIILLAASASRVARWKESSSWLIPFSFLVSASLLISGGPYVWAHERLDYAKLNEDQSIGASIPELRGLSVPGPWISEFEDLVHYAEREIPYGDAILMLPGEDLFYYATGREPRVPVLMFDRTINPYTPEELLKISRDLPVRWLIVKRELQLDDDLVAQEKTELATLLKQDFTRVKKLKNYDVYQRHPTGEGQTSRSTPHY